MNAINHATIREDLSCKAKAQKRTRSNQEQIFSFIGLSTSDLLKEMIQGQYTSIETEERLIIRRYTDGLTGENALERAVKKHPLESLSPWAEKRNQKETQNWQDSEQSAR